MKSYFNSWRKYIESSTERRNLQEAYTADDARAEAEMERVARARRAEKAAAAAAASPKGVKAAVERAVYQKLSPIARDLEQDGWDRDYLSRLPWFMAQEFSNKPDVPAPNDPAFEQLLNSVQSAAQPFLRSEYERWAAEAKERFKKDSAWWMSEGHRQYIVEPAKRFVEQL